MVFTILMVGLISIVAAWANMNDPNSDMNDLSLIFEDTFNEAKEKAKAELRARIIKH